MADNTPEGFELPVHRSLAEPMLMGGVPRGTAILLLTGAAAGVQGLGLEGLIVVGPATFAAYLGMVSLCKWDPQIQSVFKRYWNQPDVLEL
jgi:type IV secretion system protein VirB3